MKRHASISFARLLSAGLLAAVPLLLEAQPGGFPGGPPAGPPPSPRDAAPVDLTGYWVSIVVEDWIERMSPDSSPSGTGGGFGGFGGGPDPGAEAEPISNPDDPCRVYAAGGSLRVPGRVHISWQDERTLQLDLDAGSQRRIFHFDPAGPLAEGKTLQGYSVASWETGQTGGGGFGGGRGRAPAEPPAWGKLKVVTTNLTGGYLLSSRSNYGADAVVTEHFTYHSDFGREHFTVTAIVEDGGTTNVTSSTFKKEPDGSKFNPTGCEIVR